MILVDSSVWIAFFNGQNLWQVDALDRLLGEDEVCLGDLILTEVLQGFRNDLDFLKARAALLCLPIHILGGQNVALRSNHLVK